MAARKTRGTLANPWSAEHRARISTTMLLKRLEKHAFGEIELTATQVQSIQVLLKKVLPDLSSIEHFGETQVNHVILQTLPTPDEWDSEYIEHQ